MAKFTLERKYPDSKLSPDSHYHILRGRIREAFTLQSIRIFNSLHYESGDR